jgi:hypothetical protein
MFLVYMWPSGKIPAQKQTKKDLSHLLDWEVWNQQCSLPPQTSNYEAIIYTVCPFASLDVDGLHLSVRSDRILLRIFIASKVKSSKSATTLCPTSTSCVHLGLLIGGRVNSDRLDAQSAARLDHTACDLTAVGNQDLIKNGLLGHCDVR